VKFEQERRLSGIYSLITAPLHESGSLGMGLSKRRAFGPEAIQIQNLRKRIG